MVKFVSSCVLKNFTNGNHFQQLVPVGGKMLLCCCFCCLSIAQRANKCSRRVPGCFTLIGDKAPPAARDSSEVARA